MTVSYRDITQSVIEGLKAKHGQENSITPISLAQRLQTFLDHAVLQDELSSILYEFSGLNTDVQISHNLAGKVRTSMIDDTGQTVYPVVTEVDDNTISVAAGETLKGYITVTKLT
tara:strand:+ start:159 stop:503 length:345 start_codon:yes stop_codon:yes gene_type:complete